MTGFSRFLAHVLLCSLAGMQITSAGARQTEDPRPGKPRLIEVARNSIVGQRIRLKLQRLADGDSFSAYDDTGTRYEVRLAAIDAPERDQPGARAATESLRELIGARWFELEVRKRDRYGRLVGRVLIDGQDAGLHQVRRGLAWHFRRFEKEQPASQRAQFRKAQQAARRENIGLWKEANPQPPWEWRRDKRRKRRAAKEQ